jgi:hypothetical protein
VYHTPSTYGRSWTLPELNGSFKISLTNNNEKFLKHKPIENRRSNPCDIVPLCNQSWNTSFGQAEIAKSAVANRGWNPCNYYLLDSPGLIKLEKSLPSNEPKAIASNNSTEDRNLLDNVNLEGTSFGGYLAILFEDTLKTEGIRKIMVEVILAHFREPSDERVGKKIHDAKEQFASWAESRLLRYLNIAGVIDNNTNENDIVFDPQSCNSEEHFYRMKPSHTLAHSKARIW